MPIPTLFRIASVAIAAVLSGALSAAPSSATEVGGGGGSRVDCLATLNADVNTPVTKPRNIRCHDGDVACDLDGMVNGVCNFQVAVCANSTFNPGVCNLTGVRLITVDHAVDNGDQKFDPEFQALQTRIDSDIGPFPNNNADQCSNATNLHVAIKGPFKDNKCKKNKKTVRLASESTVAAGQGAILVDKDRIDLICEPPISGCDPQSVFTSAYDRVQRQIFNQSCAVSGCHDSNSFSDAGNLLLEASAYPGNLLDRTPTNAAAAGLGWKRIVAGDPATSYVVHKLDGDFPSPDFGDRMPKDRPKLDQTLIDVITAWIQAGAPDMGWPPGTF
jgi:hypothetical protein